ncbi:MAG: CpsD/CapB family tyrosine-protein kinase [Pseudomonadota bacterium]
MVDTDRLAERNIVGHLPSGRKSNVFRMLRTQVLSKLRSNNCKVLAIVGPTEGIGKSYVALNLALSIANQGTLDVSLVDLDLRKPSVARILDVSPTHSVLDYLVGGNSLSDVGFNTQFDNITFYTGRAPTDRAAELLASNRARDLITNLSSEDNALVIVDLPPMCGIADVHTFLPNCDAALLVMQYAKTSKQDIEETIRLLGKTPLVGSVINQGLVSENVAYGYGYGDGSDENS